MGRFKIIILLALLSSCTAEQRIARILKRHPELVKRDTIFKNDTIWTKSVQKDTTFYYNQPDTVYVNNDRLQIKYFYNRHDSTVFVDGKCKGDTIYKKYPVYINNLSVAKALTFGQRFKIWMFDNWWLLLGIIAGIYFIFRKALKVYFPFL